MKRPSDEIFKLHATFKDFPRQAYTLHLVGIVPNDYEDDWADSITNKLWSHLVKVEKSSEHFEYEAQIMFPLRHAFVASMVRAVDGIDGVVHVAIVDHLIEKRLATVSHENRQKSIELAKANGR